MGGVSKSGCPVLKLRWIQAVDGATGHDMFARLADHVFHSFLPNVSSSEEADNEVGVMLSCCRKLGRKELSDLLVT